MRTIILHRWLVTGRDGRRRPTRHLMTEVDALATDRTAEPIPGTADVRHVPDAGEYRGHDCLAETPGRPPSVG